MDARFDDGKEDGALRTIGEVAQALGIKQHVLRYWEQQFPMLQPLKRSGGRRYYRAADIALVETIDRLVNREGYTLKGALKALSQKDQAGAAGAEHVAGLSQEDGAATPQAPSAATLPFADELPQDGGLEAFFGKAPEPQPAPAASSVGQGSVPPEPRSTAVPPEMIASLRSIRDRLAEALAA